MKNERVPIYVLFRFNSYSGNFDKEFVAYLLGYENPKRIGDYSNYVADYKRTSDKYKTINDFLMWTKVEEEDSMYDIVSSNNSHIPDSVLIQFKKLPESELLTWLTERAKSFPSYIKKHEITGIFRNLNLEDSQVISHGKYMRVESEEQVVM